MSIIATREEGAAGRARRALRSLTAYAGAAALGASLTVAAAPAALADEAPVSLEGGSATWGVKESFRNYVGSPIADGGYETSDGATVNDDGTIDFPTVDGLVSKEDASGEVAFGGGVVFSGHDYGQGAVLEVRLADPRVEFDGDGSATVFADVTSREFGGTSPNTPPGELIAYGEVAVAELTGAALVVDGDDLSFTSAAGTLHADAVEPFAGFYNAGAPMDPLSFTTAAVDDGTDGPDEPGEPAHDPRVTISKTADLDPEGETVTVDGSGFRPGSGVYVALTGIPRSDASHPEHWYGSGVWLRDGSAPDAAGAFSTELEVVGAFEKGGTAYDCVESQCYVAVFNDRHDLANRDQDVWTPIGFATEDDGDGGDGDGDGDGGDDGELPEGDLTVHNGRADWGVKESFRTYIEGTIAKGEIGTSDGATRNDDGTFSFTDATGAVNLQDITAEVDLTGTVLFEGHVYGDADPLLYMSVADPRVEIDGATGTLYADVVSKSLTDSELVTYDDVALADLDLSGVDAAVDEGVLTWGPIPATLTAEGVPAFADFYVEGERLDPISLTLSVDEDVRIPGGGTGGGDGGGDDKPTPGPGDGDGGGKPGLPNTGTALAGLLTAAVVAVAAGGVAVAASRRRSGADVEV
ncbi:HtaA domain-containing protein [Nocardiopsis sp. MG754419]|uniref:HtaA domain-containing protein n=1 Tax=Nocardiopsis sp. MG754419 TaxID=2259865 RepID=UPI001BA82C5F|nr:HtaA domain-containing protein [Nocardiopsis sp. MG754419]MBR8740457.1 Htaa domain-containing protein [Nocardiopsis sp. MG754419]